MFVNVYQTTQRYNPAIFIHSAVRISNPSRGRKLFQQTNVTQRWAKWEGDHELYQVRIWKEAIVAYFDAKTSCLKDWWKPPRSYNQLQTWVTGSGSSRRRIRRVTALLVVLATATFQEFPYQNYVQILCLPHGQSLYTYIFHYPFVITGIN